MLGKAISLVFRSPLIHIKMSPGFGTLSYQEIKSSHSLCWTYRVVWEHLSLPQAQWMLSCLCSKHVHHKASSQPCCYICPLPGGYRVLLVVGEGYTHANCLASTAGRDPVVTEAQHTLLRLILHSPSLWKYLTVLCLPWDSDIKMQWSKVFRVLPWNW